MRILIVGASSFIGYRLYKYLEHINIYEIFGTFFKNKKDEKLIYFDITEGSQIEKTINYVKPDVVVWVAGSKNLKECENSLVFAKTINTIPVENFLKALKKIKLDTHFIFLSTDYVFNGKSGNFLDSDIPEPKTNYGLSNYLAEQIIISSKVRFSVIRTSAVMGMGGTFFDWLVNGIKNQNTLELFHNIIFTPTPVEILCYNIFNIIDKNIVNKTMHICGNKSMSRFDFGMLIKNIIADSSVKLIPIIEESDILLFQKDLSLKPSITYIQDNPLEWYLAKEIQA